MAARSPAAELNAPEGAVSRLAERAGVEVPALQAARHETERYLQTKRAEPSGLQLLPDAAVVLFGSSARGERTPGVPFARSPLMEQVGDDLDAARTSLLFDTGLAPASRRHAVL